jgi:hypothetical protein
LRRLLTELLRHDQRWPGPDFALPYRISSPGAEILPGAPHFAEQQPMRRTTMAEASHKQAAKAHEDAAKAHHTAAEHHGKGDHKSGSEHSQKAHTHSESAHKHSTEAHKKSGQHAKA